MRRILKIKVLLAVTVVVLSVSAHAQSIEPTRLDDCALETERFLAERQDEIEREAKALQESPEAVASS